MELNVGPKRNLELILFDYHVSNISKRLFIELLDKRFLKCFWNRLILYSNSICYLTEC
jgi:hypothetical protein